MKNPKSNPEIEKIKARLRKEIGYMPGDSIPNSMVSKKLEMLEATATLEYAKKQNRKVRKALPGECEVRRADIYKQYQKKQPDGMYNSKEAAEKLGISRISLWHHKKSNNIAYSVIGKRHYYSESEINRFKVSVLKTA